MRKVKASDELRPEYKREDLGVGVRGKYYEEYCKGTNPVRLSPDVAKVFSTGDHHQFKHSEKSGKVTVPHPEKICLLAL